MQHDMVLENQAGAAFRADLNDAIAALVTNSSGPTAPSVTYAFMFWADTSAGQMKQRDSTNTDWILIGSLDEEGFGSLPAAGGTLTGDLTLSGATLIEAEGSSVAAAATTDIWGAGNTKHITGNTTISSFGTAPQAGAWMKVIFDGTPTLTHSADLNLNNGGSDIAIQAGDYAWIYADSTTQFDVIVFRKNGTAIAGGGDASETAKGIVELASDAEVQSGTDTTRAITPAGMNNALGFSAYYESPQQTLTAGGSLTLAHGIGRKPILVKYVLQCVTAQGGYSVGDEVTEIYGDSGNRGITIVPDHTNINIRFGSDASVFFLCRKDSGASFSITPSVWRLVVRAWG